MNFFVYAAFCGFRCFIQVKFKNDEKNVDFSSGLLFYSGIVCFSTH